jgi:hypothetical protein
MGALENAELQPVHVRTVPNFNQNSFACQRRAGEVEFTSWSSSLRARKKEEPVTTRPQSLYLEVTVLDVASNRSGIQFLRAGTVQTRST